MRDVVRTLTFGGLVAAPSASPPRALIARGAVGASPPGSRASQGSLFDWDSSLLSRTAEVIERSSHTKPRDASRREDLISGSTAVVQKRGQDLESCSAPQCPHCGWPQPQLAQTTSQPALVDVPVDAELRVAPASESCRSRRLQTAPRDKSSSQPSLAKGLAEDAAAPSRCHRDIVLQLRICSCGRGMRVARAKRAASAHTLAATSATPATEPSRRRGSSRRHGSMRSAAAEGARPRSRPAARPPAPARARACSCGLLGHDRPRDARSAAWLASGGASLEKLQAVVAQLRARYIERFVLRDCAPNLHR